MTRRLYLENQDEYASIDINVRDLVPETVKRVEAFANQIIYENRTVTVHIVSPEDLSRFPIRKRPTVNRNIRIIEIDHFDYSPCGGTHCAHTGEIGQIKITKYENYKEGSRVYFVCGNRALRDYQSKTDLLKYLCEAMSSGESELLQNIRKLQDDLKDIRRAQNRQTRQLLEYEALALIAEREPVDDFYVIRKSFADREPKVLKALALKILEHSSRTVILFGGTLMGKTSLIFLRSEDLPFAMNVFMKAACEILNGRGGGQPHQAQGGGPKIEKLEEALQHARNSLE